MRTKTLLCAAALAAVGLATSAMAQVYSLNVVGYVNVPLTGNANFNLIANPLNNADNSITNLFPNAQDNDQIYRWNASIQDLDSTIYTYSAFAHAWDGNFTLNPGEGVFYLNSGSDTTVTFVGDVVQGSYTNPVPVLGGAAFNMLASSVPVGGSFTNATDGLTPNDNDQIYIWNTAIQDLDSNIATYSGFAHAWDNTAITVAPGQGFFYLNSGANVSPWVRNYTVQ